MKKIPTIPIGKECKKSAYCSVKKQDKCCHQGVKHKSVYECDYLK